MFSRSRTFVVGVGLAVVASVGSIPLLGFLFLAENSGPSSWGEARQDSLLVGVATLAILILLASLPLMRRILTRVIYRPIVRSRPYRAVRAARAEYQYEPPASAAMLDGDGVPVRPPAALLWWFGLEGEGWRQAAIIGALVGVVACLFAYWVVNEDGFQPRDLFGFVWVWSLTLWLALTAWARWYVWRVTPSIAGLRAGPVSGAGFLGVLTGVALFPEAVAFIASLVKTALMTLFRAAFRLSRH